MTETIEPPMNILGTKRVGRVVVSADTVREEPDMMHNLFSYIIPVQTIYVPRAEAFEYLAISDHFDDLKDGELIPLYQSQYHEDGTIKFVRQSYKRQVPHEINQEIVEIIMNEKVDIDAFKEWIRKFSDATDDDFSTYDETFLQALNIYVHRRNNNEL